MAAIVSEEKPPENESGRQNLLGNSHLAKLEIDTDKQKLDTK